MPTAVGLYRRRLGSTDGGWAVPTAVGQCRRRLGSADGGWTLAVGLYRRRLGSTDGGWAVPTAVGQCRRPLVGAPHKAVGWSDRRPVPPPPPLPLTFPQVFVWWAPEDQFWPDDVHHFSCADLVPGAAPPPPLAPPTAFRCIVNLRAVARAPVLMALVGPHCAAEVEGRDDEAVVDQLLRALALLFPGPVPRPRGHRVTRWGRDPCSRGAYSYLPPGVTPGARDALARPTPPVYWAGEACSAAFPSSVHGAHVSGRQAAQQLLQALGEGAQAEAAATAVVEP